MDAASLSPSVGCIFLFLTVIISWADIMAAAWLNRQQPGVSQSWDLEDVTMCVYVHKCVFMCVTACVHVRVSVLSAFV